LDPIGRGRRLRLVQRRVRERRVLQLIRQGLTVGVVADGRGQATPNGTPQGGGISPLLADSYLHVLDRWGEERHAGGGRLYRDADDLAVVCRTPQQAVAAQKISGRILEWLQLKLQPATTRVVGMADEGVDFLGCQVHKQPSTRTRRRVPYAWPRGKARRGGRAKIRQQTARCRLRVDLAELVAGLNRVIRGGRNSCRAGHSTKKRADLERYVRLRLWICLRNRQGPRGHWRPEGSAAWRRRSGLERFYPTGWGHGQPCRP
jgi:RNA-directed DNA polymerase